MWVDVTDRCKAVVDAAPSGLQQAAARLSGGGGQAAALAWQGHVHRSGANVASENRHRLMDLRAVGTQSGRGGGEWAARDRERPNLLLMAGSVIAHEARAAVMPASYPAPSPDAYCIPG